MNRRSSWSQLSPARKVINVGWIIVVLGFAIWGVVFLNSEEAKHYLWYQYLKGY